MLIQRPRELREELGKNLLSAQPTLSGAVLAA